MDWRRRVLPGCLALCALIGSGAAQATNVVVILADDLGYADVSAYGSLDGGTPRIPTPNIDRIGREGATFTAGYVVAPVCSPSRAGLMTGRYPQRFGFEFNNGPAQRDIERGLGLPTDEVTLGQALQGAGLRTAVIGKWHLGANDDFYPTRRGFDEFFGILPGATSFIDPKHPDARTFMRDGAYTAPATRSPASKVITGPERTVVENEDRYLTEEFAARGVEFIERNAARPFFLYLPFTAPHDPLQATQRYYDRFPDIADESLRIYSAMVSALDDGVGRVLDALERAGVADDTLVIFLSDNGCAAYYPGLCACEPLRSGKLTHFEGGVRVPFLLRWPARVAAGQRIDTPVSSLDIFPTAMAAAGAKLPTGRTYDGLDLVPHLAARGAGAAAGKAAGTLPRRDLFWWRAPMRSVRSGDWKLWVSETGAVRLLYNLAEDPAERNDLYAARPDKVRELEALLAQWHADKVPPRWESRAHTTYDACGLTVEVPI
jgi:arylsulfatase A-like enzyme